MNGVESVHRDHAVQKPTLDQLSGVASSLGFHLEQDELKSYSDFVNAVVDGYTTLEKYNEPLPEVKYPRTPGRRPDTEENPYNAWYVKTNIPGAPTGKLKGRTVAIKDSLQIAGVQMANGSKLMEGFVPDFDATVVTRLLDEGGTIVGKTNVEDMCCANSSFTCAFGPVLNFYDKTRSAGGSSSGSAVVVATGEADFAIGTDTGGSIRIPCAWNGIVGMKPTFGLVPVTGNMLIEPTLDHVGPMAKTVEDCALLLEVIAGYDDLDGRQDPRTTSLEYTKMVTSDLTGMKIGILTEGFEGAEPDVASVVRQAVDKLKTCGATVEEVSIPMFKDGAALFLPIATIGAYQAMFDNGAAALGLRGYHQTSLVDYYSRAVKLRADGMSKNIKAGFMVGRFMKDNYHFHYYNKASNVLRKLKKAYDEALEKVDVLVLPTVKFKAKKLHTKELSPAEYVTECWAPISNTNTFNKAGHPALTVNAGISEGLPVGVMFVGRFWGEGSILKAGRAVEVTRDA